VVAAVSLRQLCRQYPGANNAARQNSCRLAAQAKQPERHMAENGREQASLARCLMLDIYVLLQIDFGQDYDVPGWKPKKYKSNTNYRPNR
jgi:hypothetical protein